MASKETWTEAAALVSKHKKIKRNRKKSIEKNGARNATPLHWWQMQRYSYAASLFMSLKYGEKYGGDCVRCGTS